eukprot:15452108-Alexandrium_andersonii.AAC.1
MPMYLAVQPLVQATGDDDGEEEEEEKPDSHSAEMEVNGIGYVMKVHRRGSEGIWCIQYKSK